MVTERPPIEPAPTSEGLQSAFYEDLGKFGAGAPERLQTANVCIIGRNLISRALLRSLADCGVGRIQMNAHPILVNELHPVDWPAEAGSSHPGTAVLLCDEVPSEDALKDVSVLCAASDFGEVDALLHMNWLAIKLNKPFLPVWLSEITGHVGPLNYPHDTACFRCYQLRADSNNPNYDVARAVRRHISADPQLGVWLAGLVPPMASVLGEIAAMEIVKHLGQFVPVDTVGRMIEINLVSFSSVTRRVLKVPRCPDCGDVTVRSPVALTHGPQIPQRTGQQ